MDLIFYWKKVYQSDYHCANGEFFSDSELFKSLKFGDNLWVFGKYNSNYILIGKFVINNMASLCNSPLGKYQIGYNSKLSKNFDLRSFNKQGNLFETIIFKTKLNKKPWNKEIAKHFQGQHHVKELDLSSKSLIEHFFNILEK